MASGDFKWFGEGFDGFPRKLPEDCVEYTIHILDTKLSEAATRQRLRGVLAAVTTLTKQLLKGYIWQNEGFNIQLAREDGRSLLRGRTNYGDSIEDEWLIVYILRELSKKLCEIWIRVFDADGEFLLIEAANSLPRWLNPEVAENRVWLNKGNLLIIALQDQKDISGKPAARALTQQAAHNVIEEDPSQLLHSPKLEAEAFYRLQNYPKQINDNLHHALVRLPRKLAYVLHDTAAYISSAVSSFYLRDPIAMRPLQGKDTEHLLFPPVDLVTVSIKFTKVGYAQLKSQRFPPPQLWLKVLSRKEGESFDPQTDLGMKITSGFEMLLSDPQTQDKKQVQEIKILLDDIKNGEAELPSDAVIANWESKQDNDSWLDVNFEEFENILNSQKNGKSLRPDGAFSDKTAQENLKKMVSRFEDFLNDNAASDDAKDDLDDMDNDNDDDNDDDDNNDDGDDNQIEGLDTESSGGDAGGINFDEAKFTSLMREIMGLPNDAAVKISDLPGFISSSLNEDSEDDQLDSNSLSDEEEYTEIRRVAEAMGSELKSAGALEMDPLPKLDSFNHHPLSTKYRDVEDSPSGAQDEEECEDDEEVKMNYNLAKNLLESFKSQGGVAGPGGNLMGLMGLRFPRDEEDSLKETPLAEESKQ